MDVLKAITQEQIRTDLPKLEIGDYVKLYVRLEKVPRKESRCLRVPLFLRSMAASRKHLL